MAHKPADLLKWRENNRDQGLQYWLFCSSIYLIDEWEEDPDGKYRLSLKKLISWMRDCADKLNPDKSSKWAVRKNGRGGNKTVFADRFWDSVVKAATQKNPIIAERDDYDIVLSNEIYKHSSTYSELFFNIDSVIMSDRILEWSDDKTLKFNDAKNAIWDMLDYKKVRPGYTAAFTDYKGKKEGSLKCAYCNNKAWEHTDHVFPWRFSGRKYHHQANWIPSCQGCNGNKSDFILGRKGWELVREFYLNNLDYVTEMKSQLDKRRNHDWEEHFTKVMEKYGCYLEDTQGWNGYDHWETLGNITDIQEILQRISEM
jgi:5-methylcytosine-specific restriction endonuclease McrA